MTEMAELKAFNRQKTGKGSARGLRRQGLVPAIIYGGTDTPEGIAVPYKETTQRLHSGKFLSNVITINVEGKKQRVLARDYQLDPVRDFLLHVDFWRVSADSTLDVEVAVKFENEEECIGIKHGGVLNVVRHTIEVRCSANNIPDVITVDLLDCNIGDSIHISMISLPDGVAPTITDRDFTVATIAAPTVMQSEEVDEEPGEVEPEESEET